jgi:chromosome segregation protein
MKLSKLILSGFKSFADRTEFEFDEGISCVVGPNGCGKSNIVDAIRWVLGEQSAKSLRGSEMQDVIFNGSATRRPSGCAEVTLVFQNGRGLLPDDSAGDSPGPASITRRLFRDGRSEYLINKAPGRLRDIREMFMDTGVGNDAYSVIEQGRVESFLQASQEDRRAVFDEAAGISKYKARKREALRKLERVEQNLLRINDVLAEVDKRLRSIKWQAGKARSYQAYVERLKELRSLHYLAQYHALGRQRQAIQARLDAGNDELALTSSRLSQLDTAASGAQVELADLDRAARDLGARLAGLSSQIVAAGQRVQMLEARAKELADQVQRGEDRRGELQSMLARVEQDRAARAAELEQLQQQLSQLNVQYEQSRTEHSAGELDLVKLNANLEDEKSGTIDLLRRTAQLHNEIQASQIRRENLSSQSARLTSRAGQIDQGIQQTLTERAAYQAKLDDVREVITSLQGRLEQTRAASQQMADSEQHLQTQLSAVREQRSAVLSRTQAIEEMLCRLEGVSEATRRVLEARASGRLGPVIGMLGDFVTAQVERASVVEAALAGADQQLLVRTWEELSAVLPALQQIAGRNGAVELMCLDHAGGFHGDFDARSCPQIVARVLEWAQYEDWLAPAMWRLLGQTFVVAHLDDARLAAMSAPAGARFVTLSGDVLEPDGRVRLGCANRAAGVISRRSELVGLQQQATALDEQIRQLTQQHRSAQAELSQLEKTAQSLRTALYESNTERVECEARLKQLTEQIHHLEQEKPLIAQDLENLSREIESAVAAEHAGRQKAQELDELNAQRQQAIAELTAQVQQVQQRQAALAARMTETKVSLAAAQEKARSLQEAIASLARQQQQMQHDLSAAQAEIALNQQRRHDTAAAVEQARDEVQSLQAQQQALQQESRELEESRNGLNLKLEEIRCQSADLRKAQEGLAAQVSAMKVELGEVEVRIESLVARAQEDMSMNLLDLYPGYRHDEQRDWDAVASEIQDLRGKIERLGNVNLDAIAEQEDLEKRSSFLREQLDDITRSRDQLNDLIRRINKESRQLFLESFEEIRGHFQELFRKLFNGGKADILLTDSEDVLECGIEIVARPPGKELRTLSLLSGGEKTMTAISLLFSIFKSRPSPFCLLDEVDAALDETNIERFTRLVREFMDASQFIIISHSKRTMSMTNVLYGVTMQEPGVSQRISIRFEDATSPKLTPELAAKAG